MRAAAMRSWMGGLGVLLVCGAGLWGFDEPRDAAQPEEKKPAPLPAAKIVHQVSGLPDWATAVAFSPDGRHLAVGSYGSVRLVDVATKKEVAALQEKGAFVKSLAFTSDGKQLWGGTYQSIGVWDVETKSRVGELAGHRGYVTSLSLSRDGERMASGSEDETVRLWDVKARTSLATLSGHTQPVMGVAFSPDGKRLASCSGDSTRPAKQGEVVVWDVDGREAVHTWPGHDRGLCAVAFSPAGDSLATASFDELIKLWRLGNKEPEELKTLEGHGRPVNSVVFVPETKLLLSGAGGRYVGKNEIRLWSTESGEELGVLGAHEGPIFQIALSPDGALLATASGDKSAAILDLRAPLAAAQGKPVEGAAEPVAAVGSTTVAGAGEGGAGAEKKVLRVGIIGLDTSHAPAFTQVLNDKDAKEDVMGCRVVAAYPKGSPDIESSTSRVPGYIEQLKKLDVEIVDSIPALLEKVDCVLLETNDGRPHLEQLLPCLKAGKPTFIDKPIAGSLADVVAIFEASKLYKVPVWSSSSLRYVANAEALRKGEKIGPITGCDAFSPCSLEKTHPDLFWYGVHGVELLFTVMGTGCESVVRVSTAGTDVAVGEWKDGRVGTFRGIRNGTGGYGGTAFGAKGIEPLGSYGGYRPLVVEIVKFFRTGTVPVSPEETIEIFAFMEAADESKRQGGKPVRLEAVLNKAREEAAKIKLD